MDWSLLLSTYRLQRGPSPADDLRTEFQRDFDRIVFSGAFRRLQDKTQIFPFSTNDYAHTRLTHSMEVACVARSLGTVVGAFVVSRGEAVGVSPHEFGSVASAAALAHDIGNPPFGHAGELLIRKWFATEGLQVLDHVEAGVRNDLLGFDGNAHGFRVLARLQNARNRGGMQLTCAVLGAFAKYPYQSSPVERKSGFYSVDRPLFEEVAQRSGLVAMESGRWCRHPLAYVVEAADDICYSIVDIEDGYRLEMLDFEEASALLEAVAGRGDRLQRSASFSQLDDPGSRLGYLRALAIDALVADAASSFVQAYDRIMAGERVPPLLASGSFGPELARISEVCQRKLYRVPEFSGADSLAWRIISSILRKNLLETRPHDGQSIMRVVDVLAGMTDSYAARAAGVKAGAA